MASPVSVYHVSEKGSLVVCREPQCSVKTGHLSQASAENVLNGNITTVEENNAWFRMKTASGLNSSAVDALTYEQMVARAKLFHPDAEVNVEDGEWVITIKPRGVKVSRVLPESYRNTPAWDAYQTATENGSNVLEDFMYNRYPYADYSISQAAKEYNVAYKRQEWINQKMSEFREENGIPSGNSWLYDDNEVGEVQVKTWAKMLLEQKNKIEKESYNVFVLDNES